MNIGARNCRFENNKGADSSSTLATSSASISFRDCRLVDCCTALPKGPDVKMQTRLWDTPRIGGVDFGNLEIQQPFPRPKFSELGEDWLAPGTTPARLGMPQFRRSGTVFIDAPGADAFLFLSPDRYWRRQTEGK